MALSNVHISAQKWFARQSGEKRTTAFAGSKVEDTGGSQ